VIRKPGENKKKMILRRSWERKGKKVRRGKREFTEKKRVIMKTEK